ncbi:hypothetical protein MP228_007717 [Amoeboaphelidium protococcarum]|nr:hypothetical protein MP228_007717 [Amoeboaphelidium protococcarum]
MMIMMISQKFLVALVSCFLVQFSLAAVSSEIQQLLQLVNAERAAKGAQPLCFNDKLNQIAQQHAQELNAAGSLSHEGADGTNLPTRLKQAGMRLTSAGENLAKCSQPQDAIYGWTKSPSHYSAMTDPRQFLTGIGRSGDRWVMLYAAARDEQCSSGQSAPAAADPPPPPPSPAMAPTPPPAMVPSPPPAMVPSPPPAMAPPTPAIADTPAPSNPNPPPPPPPPMVSPTPSPVSAPAQQEAACDLSSFANPDVLKSVIASLVPGLSVAPEKLDEIIQTLQRHGIGKGGVKYMAG